MVSSHGVAVRKRRQGHGGRRPGAGRPRLFYKKTRLAVDMEKSDYEALKQLAKKRGDSIPALVRSVLTAFLKRQKR